MNDDNETISRPQRRRWLSLWIVSEVIAVISLVAWYEWPLWRSAESPVASALAGAMVAPVTNDSSVRTAATVGMGSHVEFDTLMADVRTLNNTIAVDMRYRDSGNFTGAPLPGYGANRAYLRREAAAALARVQQDLAGAGTGILVYDAYRPVRATEAMVAWTQRVHRETLVTDGYISDRSRHNLGVAIDCTLITLATGIPLDMGVPFDTFSKDAHTANASGLAGANRQRFVAAMAREGFTNYEQEWWHFTFDVAAESLRRFDVVIRE